MTPRHYWTRGKVRPSGGIFGPAWDRFERRIVIPLLVCALAWMLLTAIFPGIRG